MHTSRTPGALSVHDIPKLRISRSFSTPTRKLFPTQAKRGIFNTSDPTCTREQPPRGCHDTESAVKIKQEIYRIIPFMFAAALRHLFLIASKLD
jgi:hypothetical protein